MPIESNDSVQPYVPETLRTSKPVEFIDARTGTKTYSPPIPEDIMWERERIRLGIQKARYPMQTFHSPEVEGITVKPDFIEITDRSIGKCTIPVKDINVLTTKVLRTIFDGGIREYQYTEPYELIRSYLTGQPYEVPHVPVVGLGSDSKYNPDCNCRECVTEQLISQVKNLYTKPTIAY